MNNNIRELLMSFNHEDVELGIILAKKKRISAKWIDDIVQERYYNHIHYDDAGYNWWSTDLNNIFRRYLDCKPRSEHFIKWKKDE